jgi:hypothetical protein
MCVSRPRLEKRDAITSSCPRTATTFIEERRTGLAETGTKGGIMSNGGGRSAGVGLWGFGSMLAITLSWSVSHSILWMIVHGIFSWFYVIYYAVEK